MLNRLPPSPGIIIFAGISLVLSLTWLLIRPGYADAGPEPQAWPGRSITSGNAFIPANDLSSMDSSPPGFNGTPLIAPANAATVTNPRPTFDWADANDDIGVVSYTLRITGESPFSGLSTLATTAEVTTTGSIYTPTQILPNGVFTWTVQAYDAAGNVSGFVAPYTFTITASGQIYLPVVQFNPQPTCPANSNASFEIIPIDGDRADHPDYLHGDLNLSLRGYAETNAAKTLQDYNGSADPNAPQLAGIFNPNQFSGISTVYRVNHWDWGCGVNGCPGPPITNPEVTLIGLAAAAGQPVHIPERAPEIYGGGYKAMVLYAEERRITLGYTRQDSVAPGYAVHLENLCVDPNLLALYREQVGPDGLRIFKNGSYWLPALRNDQALGVALDDEIQVAIRDRGAFMDPRSRKDWWVGY